MINFNIYLSHDRNLNKKKYYYLIKNLVIQYFYIMSHLKRTISLKVKIIYIFLNHKILKKKLKNFKIFDLLKRHAAKNDENLINKIQSCFQIKRVDKSSKFFALFTLDLKNLSPDIDFKNVESFSFESNDDYIESIKIDRNKLIIQANKSLFKKEVIENIFTLKSNYGFENSINNGFKTIIEFSSPNIAKPLHAGHMRSTFLGNFLSNIHQKLGHKVTKINYLGDWGTQYGILAVGFKKYGSYSELEKSPIKHLLDVYVKANQDEGIKTRALDYFSKMEDKDPDSLKMWTLFKELSIKELQSVYEVDLPKLFIFEFLKVIPFLKKLNIQFDVYESESEYYELAKEYVKKMLEIGLAERL